MKKKICLILVLLVLAGCDPDPDAKVNIPSSFEKYQSRRFDLTRELVIEDDLAYGSRRGIYTLVDKKTGKEYIGISGIGISETGTHSSGKGTAIDER